MVVFELRGRFIWKAEKDRPVDRAVLGMNSGSLSALIQVVICYINIEESMSTAWSISSFVTVSGGRSRMTFGPADTSNRPAFSAWSM